MITQIVLSHPVIITLNQANPDVIDCLCEYVDKFTGCSGCINVIEYTHIDPPQAVIKRNYNLIPVS